MEPAQITNTKRKINYFELDPDFKDGKVLDDFKNVFNKIITLSKTKSFERFVFHNDKQLYLTEIKFDGKNQRISGKLLNIRMDSFPELMNTADDKIRDIEAADEEGIIESSHFILSYSKEPLILALEFNQYGPRISDFISYISSFSMKYDVCNKVNFVPIVRDDLPEYKRRINNISLVIAKVHKDNVKRIQQFDSELFDAFDTASKFTESEYVTLQLNYDYRHLPSTPKIKGKVIAIIDKLIQNKSLANVFDKFFIKAQDEDYNNRIKDFDLLNIWVKSDITVQKKPKSRVIVTTDILFQMANLLVKEFKR